MVLIAPVVSAADFGSGGTGFKSHWWHHTVLMSWIAPEVQFSPWGLYGALLHIAFHYNLSIVLTWLNIMLKGTWNIMLKGTWNNKLSLFQKFTFWKIDTLQILGLFQKLFPAVVSGFWIFGLSEILGHRSATIILSVCPTPQWWC